MDAHPTTLVIAENLRGLMEERGETGRPLSQRIGRGSSLVSDILNGHTYSPTVAVCDDLARGLNTTLIGMLLPRVTHGEFSDLWAAFQKLDPADRARLLVIARALAAPRGAGGGS